MRSVLGLALAGVYNPLENMYMAVTRQNLHGKPEGGWHPEQRITIDEAIRAIPPADLLKTEVRYTLVGGRIVHGETP